MRREFELLPEDEQFLEEYGLSWETVVDSGNWALIHDFPTHVGYDHQKVTTAIRIPTGYPNTRLDMVWFYPVLARTDGKPIGATPKRQVIDQKTFQRWSRHRSAANPWNPEEDRLGTHIFMIEEWLQREFEQ
jgi:Prokaryotic E2 family E